MLPTQFVESRVANGPNSWPLKWLLAFFALFAILPSPVKATLQSRNIISGPTCAVCRIVVEHEATIGDDAEGSVGEQFAIFRDAYARYLVSYPQNSDELLVFDSAGRYASTIGRRGRGPGEFRGINWIDGLDSTIFVFDGMNRTVTRLSSSFDVLNTFDLPGQATGAAVLSGGRLVLNANIMTRDRAGYTLHIIDSRGRIIRSIDDSGQGFRSDFGYMTIRRLARASPNSFWSAPVSSYRLTEFNATGSMLREFERKVDWFEPYVGRGVVADPKVPPQPMLKDLQVDQNGLIWVLVNVADTAWHKAVVPDPIGPTGYGWNGDWNQFYDTVVEVIDPESREVIASRRLDQCLWRFTGVHPNIAASYKAPRGDEITPRIELWRLGLQRETSHGRR